MTSYQVFHPDHEVIGQTVLDLQNAVGGETIYPIYQKHGLGDVDPKAWYPMQKMLDALQELGQQGGTMFDLISVGMKTVENLLLPPEAAFLSLVELFQLSSNVYQLNSRGSNIGGAKCEVVSDRYVKMHYTTPLPDDFMYGIVYGYAKHFLPRGSHVVAFYDPDIPRRDEGGDTTIIHAKWEIAR